ncbi:MAG TPA: hypothetical protein VKU41_09970 [Polyangiaceae bacterium]|nr:hypothetical protein [Polyangiaceae bacterium]
MRSSFRFAAFAAYAAAGPLALLVGCSSGSAQVPATCDGGACPAGPDALAPRDAGSAADAPEDTASQTPEAAGPGGEETGTPPLEAGMDAGAEAEGGPSYSVAVLGPADVCLPSPLPASPDGGTSCAVLLVGVPSGCGQPGLAPLTPSELAFVEKLLGARDAAMLNNACELQQLPAAPSSGTDCASAGSGWCYVPRACASNPAPCTQALCSTAAFDSNVAQFGNQQHPGYGTAFLYCP